MEKRDDGTQQQQGTTPAARYKGVRMRRWGKWVAEVRYPNSRRRLWVGSFNTAEMAAGAYDAAVYCIRGPGAGPPNFPDHPPDIPDAARLSRYEIRQAAVRHARRVAAIRGLDREPDGGGATEAPAADELGGHQADTPPPPPPPGLFQEFHDPALGGGDEGDDGDGYVFGSFPLWDFSE